MPEQTVAEIIKKVQRIQIVANRMVNDMFAGQYQSVFRGRGMEFEEVREYQPGDDVRNIDWNVTARTGNPFIKSYCEERELTVFFLVDVSASGAFGSLDRSKLELVIEVAAMLMFSALKNNDKVGLITFCDEVIRYFPPGKGKASVLRLIRELVSAKPVPRETDLDGALEFLNRVQKKRAVVFLVSDFIGQAPGKTMAVSHHRHDLIPIVVSDPREKSVPDVGFVRFRDAETGETVEVDTRHPEVRALFASRSEEAGEKLSEAFKRFGMDELRIDTGGEYLKNLRRFFRMRARRFR